MAPMGFEPTTPRFLRKLREERMMKSCLRV